MSLQNQDKSSVWLTDPLLRHGAAPRSEELSHANIRRLGEYFRTRESSFTNWRNALLYEVLKAGLRVPEALRLTVDDIEQMEITTGQATVDLRVMDIECRMPKPVPLATTVATELREFTHTALKQILQPAGARYLFVSESGSQLQREEVRRVFRVAGREIGIAVAPHQVRSQALRSRYTLKT
jgi:site-specific recombinase XerD